MVKLRAMNKHYQWITKEDLPFLVIVLAVLFGFITAFYNSLHASGNANIHQVIGYSIEVENIVQRKADGGIIWQDYERDQPAYEKDVIRTGANSIAIVTLTDGVSIDLDANSMILLNYDLGKNDEEIDIRYGSLRVDTSRADKDLDGVKIKKNEQEVSVRGGNIRIESTDQGDIDLTVIEGSSVVAIAGGVTKNYTEGDNITFSKGKAVRKQDQISLRIVSPADGELFYTGNVNHSVKFAYTVNDSQLFKKIKLEISLDRSFSESTSYSLAQKSKGNYSQSISLLTGSYYWRIKGERNGKIVTSNWSKFTVLRKAKLQFNVPRNDQVFDTNREKERIRFSWQHAPINKHYLLEIAQDKVFEQIIERYRTRSNVIQVTLSGGNYYARLSHVLPNNQSLAVGRSLVKFAIDYQNKPKEISLYSPQNGQTLSQFQKESKKKVPYIFNWENYGLGYIPKILIGKGKQLRNPVIAEIVRKNRFQLKKEVVQKMDLGVYYWRVEYRNPDDQLVAFSTTRSFQVIDQSAEESEGLAKEGLEKLAKVRYEILKETYPESTLYRKSGRTLKGLIVRRTREYYFVVTNSRVVKLKIADIERIE